MERCVQSILRFDLPAHVEMELFILDGMSTDTTATIAKSIATTDPRVRYILNTKLTQGCAVNAAVRATKADAVLWLGAHNEFPANYLALCHETMERTDADVVGGVCETRPGGSSYGARIVQALTTHRFGIGGGEFRVGGTEHEVDTVAYALFRTSVFADVGLLDERLVRAQDYEFNRRIASAGGLIWQNPAIRAAYYNQPSILQFLIKQLTKEAPYNAYLWYVAPYAFAPRHAVTLVFSFGVLVSILLAPMAPWLVLGAALIFGTYSALAIAAAIQQGLRYRQPSFVLTLPPCFFAFHFLHGLGIWSGLARLLTGYAPVQRAGEPWPRAGFVRLSKQQLKGKIRH